MTKILHLSNIKLFYDYSIAFRSFTKETRLENHIVESFTQFMDEKSKKVKYIILTGELYEDKNTSLGEITEIVELLEKYPDNEIIIVPPAGETYNSWYYIANWPKNVHILKQDSHVLFEQDKLVFTYGQSDIESADDFRIVMLSDEVKEGATEDVRIAYYGVNQGVSLVNGKIGCPGNFEPLDFGQDFKFGYIEIDIDGEKESVQFVERNAIKLTKKEIEISPTDSIETIVEKTNKLLKKEPHVLYQVIYKGMISRLLPKDFIKTVKESIDPEIPICFINKTNKDYYLDEIEKENYDNLIGMFIRDVSGQEMDDKKKQDILECGLDFLLWGESE